MNINQQNCIVVGGNTGIAGCNLVLGLLLGVVAVPVNAEITETEAADLITFFQNGTTEDMPSDRFYPFPRFVNLDPGGNNASTESFNYGFSINTIRGLPQFTARYTDGGMTQHTRMTRWHNSQGSYAFFFVYANAVVGYTVRAADGSVKLRPYRMVQVFVNNPTPATSSNTMGYTITFTLASERYMNEDFGYARVEGDLLSQIQGFIDVYLRGTPGTPTGHILMKATAGASDMHDLYATELADPDAWQASNATTGATIAVTAVASTAVGWDLTTAATAGTRVKISLVAPSALDALGVAGYESDSVIVTVA